jgi:REP element-mobilizing transposase RayT
MKTVYKNRLPHIAPLGATFFVTFRLADSLPQEVVQTLKSSLDTEIKRVKEDFPQDYAHRIRDSRKRNFRKFDHQLDEKSYGACQLRLAEVARILVEKLQEFEGELYDLQAFCIMPNHVHVLLNLNVQVVDKNGIWPEEAPENYVQLDKIMQLIKGGSAYAINRCLGRTGKLWFKDSYDHFVRSEQEWINIVNYILQNPVKANLVLKWEAWPFSYCKPNVLNRLLYYE